MRCPCILAYAPEEKKKKPACRRDWKKKEEVRTRPAPSPEPVLEDRPRRRRPLTAAPLCSAAAPALLPPSLPYAATPHACHCRTCHMSSPLRIGVGRRGPARSHHRCRRRCPVLAPLADSRAAGSAHSRTGPHPPRHRPSPALRQVRPPPALPPLLWALVVAAQAAKFLDRARHDPHCGRSPAVLRPSARRSHRLLRCCPHHARSPPFL